MFDNHQASILGSNHWWTKSIDSLKASWQKFIFFLFGGLYIEETVSTEIFQYRPAKYLKMHNCKNFYKKISTETTSLIPGFVISVNQTQIQY